MNDLPDVKAVRLQARTEWERTVRKHIGIQERIGNTVPWWLVLIALAFFLLSAPHTAATFNKISPGFGWIAPLGIEFCLLYTAFHKHKLKQMSKPVPSRLQTLEVFAFAVAVFVNGAGSFMSVVSEIGVNDLSFTQLTGQLGVLPASSQVALLLVPMAALIIPIGTLVAGEGMADLILERRESGNLIEHMWTEVRIEIEFAALRDAAVQKGISPGKAARWAASLVGETKQIAGSSGGQSDQLRLTDTDGHFADTQADSRTDTSISPNGHSTGRGYNRNPDARTIAEAFLADNPDAVNLSVREFAALSGVGKTVAGEVLADAKRTSADIGEYYENGN